jgi:hypothetical protein
MAQLTGKLTLAQRKAIAEALEIGWYHIGHHRECNPRPDGCECDADELKWRLGKFSSAQFIASKAAFIHEGTLDLLRALPPFVGHSWRCQGLTCHGCHYPRLVELGAEFGVVLRAEIVVGLVVRQVRQVFPFNAQKPTTEVVRAARSVSVSFDRA